MIINYTKSGGHLGRRTQKTINTNILDVAQKEEIESIIKDIDFFSIPNDLTIEGFDYIYTIIEIENHKVCTDFYGENEYNKQLSRLDKILYQFLRN